MDNKKMFRDYIENNAPNQLKVLFNELNDSDGIMLEECFNEYAEQTKGPSEEDIAIEIVARFLHNPHPNQRDKYKREKQAFADGCVFAREFKKTMQTSVGLMTDYYKCSDCGKLNVSYAEQTKGPSRTELIKLLTDYDTVSIARRISISEFVEEYLKQSTQSETIKEGSETGFYTSDGHSFYRNSELVCYASRLVTKDEELILEKAIEKLHKYYDDIDNINQGTHLRFCCMYGIREDEEAPKGHPQEVMKNLGITYQHATPQTMGDQWWFWNCENIPNLLPPYLEVADLEPMACIGYGLSEKDAEKIRDYIPVKID